MVTRKKAIFFPKGWSNCKKNWPKKKTCDCTQIKAKLPSVFPNGKEQTYILSLLLPVIHLSDIYIFCSQHTSITNINSFRMIGEIMWTDSNAVRGYKNVCAKNKYVLKAKGTLMWRAYQNGFFLVCARVRNCSICCPVLIRTILEFVTKDSLSYRPRHVECVAARRKNIFFLNMKYHHIRTIGWQPS